MTIRLAIIQCADCGPLESLVHMFRAIGIGCLLPNEQIKDKLKRIGCDTVLDINSLVENMGYDHPLPVPLAPYGTMERSDVLFVDIKAHRNGPKIWKEWPNLREHTLWYRINGGAPEHVIKSDGFDCGDEENPPCPILTPNQWYKDNPKAYTCWPPFIRESDYWRDPSPTSSPLCLIHNLHGWGYGEMIEPMRRLGVKIYGVRSPNGLVRHHEVPELLSRTLAMVHLKSSDAPGYAIYEALSAGCPIICSKRLIWRCKMQELLIPNETCLVFDRETHDELGREEAEQCARVIEQHLVDLQDPSNNKRIGEAGKEQLKKVMWTKEKDTLSLSNWRERMFP